MVLLLDLPGLTHTDAIICGLAGTGWSRIPSLKCLEVGALSARASHFFSMRLCHQANLSFFPWWSQSSQQLEKAHPPYKCLSGFCVCHVCFLTKTDCTAAQIQGLGEKMFHLLIRTVVSRCSGVSKQRMPDNYF